MNAKVQGATSNALMQYGERERPGLRSRIRWWRLRSLTLPVLHFFLFVSFCSFSAQSQTEQEREIKEADRLQNEFLQKYDASRAEELRPLIERALELREKHFGREHPVVGDTLLNVAIVQRDKGDYAKAEMLLQRALAIQEKAFGTTRPELVGALYNLAILQQIKGEYAKAEELYQRGLAILEKEFGTESLEITDILHSLAVSYSDRGEIAKAEAFYQRVLTIREKKLGRDHLDVASSLFNLGILYRNQGDSEKAAPLFQRALAIQEKQLGPEHPQVSDTLFNVAAISRINGDYPTAEKLLLRALAIQEKKFGASHPEITGCLNELALLRRDQRNLANAEVLFQRLLTIQEKFFGAEHQDVATTLNGLASVYQLRREYAKAAPLLSRALVIREKVYSANHHFVAETLHQLARLHEAIDEPAKAIEYQTRANQIIEHNVVANLFIGSERQKLAYLKMLSLGLDVTISLQMNFAPMDRAANQLSLTTLLQRKGRGLDAMTDSIANLRRHSGPQEKALLDQLAEARTQLARLLLEQAQNPAQLRDQIGNLEERVEKLEADISRRSAEFRAQSLPVTLEAVRASLPPQSALIEFAVYTPYNTKTDKFSPERYAVWVLESDGELRAKDLGEIGAINAAVGAFRNALRDPSRTEVKRVARTLDEKVMRPVRALLRQSTHLLISPDGQLNLIPFSALVDEQQRYLIERYSMTYLTSGRDLLRLQVPRESNHPPMIVADPAFGDPPTVVTTTGKVMLDDAKIIFAPLRGAREEVRAIKEFFPNAVTLTKEQATETTLKQVTSPSFLHIATHGFFLEEETTPPAPTTRNVRRKPVTRIGKWTVRVANPLLRSGLALAGANQGKSGEEDGVLTALEAAGLNLWGTKLVVLSACDTGVGEVKNGDGVYGLRRALILAGAESQIMSLWPVADTSTRDLMAGYYKALQQGEGRGEALRRVQLQMLQNKERQHPFYWASFIQSGEWANLAGKR